MRKKRLRHIELKKMDRECWNLDISFVQWLKPRLQQYLKRGGKIVDLTFYKFTIRGVEKTQEEWIKEMITICDYLLTYNWFAEEYADKMHYLCEIWTEVMFAMWW